MKKIVLLLMVLMLVGCTTSNDQEVKESIAPVVIEQEEILTIDSSSMLLDGGPDFALSADSAVLPPSSVEIFIGDEKANIGFIYEYGVDITDADYEAMNTDQDGNLFLYYGTLERIATNVYRVKGKYIPSWDNQVQKVSSTIDFYVINQEDKYYFCYEDLTLDELVKYTNDHNYATFYKNLD